MTEAIEHDDLWWRQAVTYQVYIRSFADGDGDGTGDLAGLRSRLGYLRDLGVDALWINPWYESPLNDGGYDVANYRAIDRRYGDLAGAEALISDAHDLGLKVLADLVPNHTSSEHAWFREAISAAPGDASRDRYYFRSGRGPDGTEPPNNWQSVFGGPAWTRIDDGDWYLHLFDVSQPDLNWDHPEVRADFLDIFRFWFDRGIDGFRVDVAHGLSKDPSLPDLAAGVPAFGIEQDGSHPYWDRDEVHEIIREWRSVADSYAGKVMVAEAWVSPERLPMYLESDQYHQSFDFDFLTAPWTAAARRPLIERAIQLIDSNAAMPTWVLSNHDVIRHATRFALAPENQPTGINASVVDDDLDQHVGLNRARAAAMLMLALPGSVYLYQGEELGLREVTDLPPEVLDDPIWERTGHKIKGRDGCRVPIPWTRSGPAFGFGEAAPWLPQPSDFADFSVEAQTGVAGSTLELYRSALALRRAHLSAGSTFAWIDMGDDVIAFERGGITNVTNFGDEPVELPNGTILLTSGPSDGHTVGTDVTAWIQTPS